jgi:cytochrome P450
MTATLSGRPLLSVKLETTPGEFAALLREKGPIFWWEPDHFWVVSGHELATTILKGTDCSADRSAFFMSRLAGIPVERVANFLSVVTKMMVTSDPPEHTQRRKLAAFGISDSVLDDFRPTVEKTVAALIESAGRADGIELVRQIALPLPNTVLADLFCIPPQRREDFYQWSNSMTQFFGGASEDVQSDAAAADLGAASLKAYFTELIAARRARPEGDFLSHLLKNQQAMGLDDSELISQAVMMLVAGTITTTDQICNNMYGLLTEGPALDRLRADPAILEASLEEATRLDPAVNFVFRVARRDANLGGASVKAGDLVFISNHAVNRDPAIFASPDSFRVDRAKNPHVSYGSGIHYCLGAKLGRIQMSALFGRLLQKFPRLRLDPESRPQRKQQSLAFSGFESLNLLH